MRRIASTLISAWVFSLIASNIVWANGSVIIGNKISIAPGIQTIGPSSNWVKILANQLIDGNSGEPLFYLQELGGQVGADPQLVSTSLGLMQGLERVPVYQAHDQSRYYVVCRNPQSCLKLTPLTKSNPKAPALLGGLQLVSP